MFSKTILFGLLVIFVNGLHANRLTRARARAEVKKGEFVYHLNEYKAQMNGRGGNINLVTQDQWPVLEDKDVSLIRTQLEPCGLVLIHEHPRPSEILYVNKGKHVLVGFVEEDGGRMITNNLKKGDVTLFPETLMHFQQNLGCEDAELISFLSSEDPGYVTIGAQSFKFPTEIVADSYGMSEEYVERLRNGMPYNPVEASDGCRKRCKYEKKERYGKSGYERKYIYEKPRYERYEREEKPEYEREYKEENYETPRYEKKESYGTEEKATYGMEERENGYEMSTYEKYEDEEPEVKQYVPKYGGMK